MTTEHDDGDHEKPPAADPTAPKGQPITQCGSLRRWPDTLYAVTMTPIAADEPDVQLPAELAGLRLAVICDRPITPRHDPEVGQPRPRPPHARPRPRRDLLDGRVADTLYRASDLRRLATSHLRAAPPMCRSAGGLRRRWGRIAVR